MNAKLEGLLLQSNDVLVTNSKLDGPDLSSLIGSILIQKRLTSRPEFYLNVIQYLTIGNYFKA
jgi:hypothetical protein